MSVSLGQELRWVEQYLYLQKFRLMDVFDYEIEFQEEYGDGHAVNCLFSHLWRILSFMVLKEEKAGE